MCVSLSSQAEPRTILFTRRHTDDALAATFERLGFTVEEITHVKDSKSRPLIAHFLLRRA